MTDTSLAALLTGDMPDGAQDQGEASAVLLPAADIVAALRAGPASDELAGEAAAMAEFRSRARRPGAASRARRRPTARRTSLVSGRVAAAAAAAVVGVGSVATAAYAGVLPARVQRLAHETIGAPAAGGGQYRVARPGGGHQARPWCFGIAHGIRAQRAAALRRLERAEAGQVNGGGLCRGGRSRPTSARHPGRAACRPAPAPSWTAVPHPAPSWTPPAHRAVFRSARGRPCDAWPRWPHRGSRYRLPGQPEGWPVGQRRPPVGPQPIGRPDSHPPGWPGLFVDQSSPDPSGKPAPRPHASAPVRT
jgi:hypothetical protein